MLPPKFLSLFAALAGLQSSLYAAENEKLNRSSIFLHADTGAPSNPLDAIGLTQKLTEN
jgi:hypothetical protein